MKTPGRNLAGAVTGGALLLGSSTAGAQIGAPPAERMVLPSPTLDPPLHASEVDVLTDRGAMLLVGDVVSIVTREYRYPVAGPDGPPVDETLDAVHATTLRIDFDRCGNLRLAELFGARGEAGDPEITMVFRSSYGEGCERTGVRMRSPQATPASRLEGVVRHDDEGRLVEYDVALYDASFERAADRLVSMTLTLTDLAGLSEIQRFVFDEMTGRLSAIYENDRALEVEWTGDRELRFGREDERVGWITIELDDRGRHARATLPERSWQLNGYQWMTRYEEDDQGNWTTMMVSVIPKPGDEPRPHMRLVRTHEYAE